MRFRPVLNVLLFVLVLTSARSSRCEVLHGTATILPYYMPGCDCGWDQAVDFSAQTIVSRSSQSADLSFGLNARGSGPYWYANGVPNKFFYLTDGIETLQSVPDVGHTDTEVHPTGTYVLETKENLFVKFTVRGSNGTDVTIEYFLQTDGSRYFGPVPVEQATWGKVKALFR